MRSSSFHLFFVHSAIKQLNLNLSSQSGEWNTPARNEDEKVLRFYGGVEWRGRVGLSVAKSPKQIYLN